MKGKLNPFTMLVIILLVVAAVIIAVILLGRVAGFDFSKYFPMNFTSGQDGDQWRWIAAVGNLPVVDVTGDGQPLTASSVACSMANDIHDDFMSVGDADHGDSLPFTKQRLVTWRVFQIPQSYYDNGKSRLRPISAACHNNRLFQGCDLSPRQLTALENAGCRICGPYLDEQCLNAQLAVKQVQGQPFCDYWSAFVGGVLVHNYFTNAFYDTSAGNGPWGDDGLTYYISTAPGCVASGPQNEGGDRISGWKADDSSNPYTVDDSGFRTNGHPPASTNPIYAYLLLWNPQEYDGTGKIITKIGSYEIDILKVPRLEQRKIPASDLADDVHERLGNWRTHPAGAEIGELRRVADTNYTLFGQDDFSGFIQKFNSSSGVASVSLCESFGDCLQAAAESTVEYRRMTMRRGNQTFDWVYNPYGVRVGDGNVIERYNLFSNLYEYDALDGNVRAVIDNWMLDGKADSHVHRVACVQKGSHSLVSVKSFGSDDEMDAAVAGSTMDINLISKSTDERIRALTGCDTGKTDIYTVSSETTGAMGRNIVIWYGPTD